MSRPEFPLSAKVDIPPDVVREQSNNLSKLLDMFTEGSAYVADYIRLTRLETFEKILRKAKEICERYNIPPSQLPLKFMLQFGEKSSYEDETSEMHQRWISLLVSSALDPNKAHPAYIDILSQIGPEEAFLLKSIWESFAGKTVSYLELMQELTPDILTGRTKYGHLIASGRMNNQDTALSQTRLQNIKSLQILERQNLLKYHLRLSNEVMSPEINFELTATLTPLGFDFTEFCEKYSDTPSSNAKGRKA